nr:HAD-IC family P-type ATPase [Eubacterium sp.]
MDKIRSTKEIIAAHTLTYFNFLNLVLAGLIVLSGQHRNMLFMGIVVSNALIGIIQELKVKKLVDALSVVTATKAKLVCEEGVREVPVEYLEVGHVIRLSLGDQIPVDCEAVESQGAEVNESLLTGESLAVRKQAGDFLYSGSDVVAGTLTARVLHVGRDNYASQLVQKAKKKRRATSEMQNAIQRMIKYVGRAILPIGIVLYLIQRQVAGNSVSDSLVNTVAGVLGMIPEGLVLLTSVSFILGVGRLAKKNALVQEMEAIEALARVDVLCLDKTGTITTGDLRVERVIGLGSYREKEISEIMGNLVYAFEETNHTTEALRQYYKKESSYDIRERIPFSSSRKCMGITVREDAREVTYRLGAPEYLGADEEVLCNAEDYAKMGMRVLYLQKDKEPVALLLLSDVIKKDAPHTFRFFEEKGVVIKILSGDNPMTVSAVGVRAGLAGAENYVDAGELPEKEEKLREEVEKYTVFGRVSPEQKQRIVNAIEANGNVTGMVGDGVNDVLALKDADCGIAMASGSDAAKQTAHIVLLDSDFASMKDIVKEGRTIIANIERVSALYLTKTLYSIFLCVVFIILGKTYPFIPIQLSLIGATAIGIPSFLLAFERHEDTIPKGFLKNVLRISLPAALILTIALVVFTYLEELFHAGDAVTGTLNLLAGGAVSFGVLLSVCIPMSRWRFVLCVVVIGAFCGAILLFPEFFNVISVPDVFRWIGNRIIK